jgi:hypothetical protein
MYVHMDMIQCISMKKVDGIYIYEYRTVEDILHEYKTAEYISMNTDSYGIYINTDRT